MTTTRIDHSTHDHDTTPYATYLCRKAIRQKAADRAHAVDELVATFDAKDSSRDWLAYAARRFAGAETSDRRLQDIPIGPRDFVVRSSNIPTKAIYDDLAHLFDRVRIYFKKRSDR